MKIQILITVFAAVFISCNSERKAEKHDLLITNVQIIDIQKDTILKNSFIAISDDTIKATGNMKEIGRFEAEDSLDAQHNFALPGLWDMHVHFRGGDSLVAENKDLLKLFLAYGVTTVKDAGGDITPSVLEWRKNIQNGTQPGPRIFSSGPKLDGSKPAWEGSIKVTSEAEIQAALDSLQFLNVDFVKMYDGNLEPEIFYGIIEEAEIRGLKTTGHMPLQADFMTAIDLGLDGIEHMYYTVKASSPLADSLAKTNLGYGMMGDLIKTYDEGLAQKVFTKMATENVTITPTLHIGKTLANLLDTDHEKDATLGFMGKGIQQTYQRRVESAKRAKASGSTMRSEMEKLSNSMIVPMFEAGVPILAGSDSGAFNSFVYPGESLHSELEELVNAGLTPKQALKTSIFNGPAYFSEKNNYGSLSEGKIADIIILEKNPLDNIKNTRTIKFVLTKNKIYNPGDLLKDLKN